MKDINIFPLQMLGQSGVKLLLPKLVVYVDPYLSNSVQELDSHDLARLVPIPSPPEEVADADIVLITHNHIDHCDPHTLVKLSKASPQAHFFCPAPVLRKLAEWGIPQERVSLTSESWCDIKSGIRIRAVPAAHQEIHRDADGNLECIGFLLEYCYYRFYFAGDTMARQEIIDNLVVDGPIDVAFLPVNEHNFFRWRRCILGNMSVREAFQFGQEIGARHVVPVHWDMFEVNSTYPEEIRLIYERMNPGFSLLLRPTVLNFRAVDVSVVIRTLNEARYLEELLQGLKVQVTDGLVHEVVLVDSGSTDGTVAIAERFGCRIQHIAREAFSFGRSLNIGCEAASGEILVITSGHCVPADDHWLQRLCQPILDKQAEYVYGCQLGGDNSHLSEKRIFHKHFPGQSAVPQFGFFCNNANSALHKSTWERYRFDEELTGLEDLELAQRLVNDGGRVAYVAEAAVFHHHAETWPQVRRRFEREAIALQKIMPQLHVSLLDTLRYFATSVWKDWVCARDMKVCSTQFMDIVRYRWNQYIGTWRGNHQHRKLSQQEKDQYFYPH